MKIKLQDKIYYYNCDGFDDSGWGCVYRCLQTLLENLDKDTPSVLEIMKLLDMKYNPHDSLINMWIEPIDCVNVLKNHYKIDSKLICYKPTISNEHDRMNRTTNKDFQQIFKNESILFFIYDNLKHPMIIDDGVYSYLLYGVDDHSIYIIDPHKKNNNQKREFSIGRFLDNFWMIAYVC